MREGRGVPSNHAELCLCRLRAMGSKDRNRLLYASFKCTAGFVGGTCMNAPPVGGRLLVKPCLQAGLL